MSDDDRPDRGLPERLPADEHVLWRGGPQWRVLARTALHTRLVAAYFILLLAWAFGSAVAGDQPALSVASSTAIFAGLAVTATGILALYAWLTSRATVYTITNRRVVMQIGIALSVTLNIPFRIVESASVAEQGGGVGDIPLRLAPDGRIAYLVLWPHARPWRVSRPEPMLRAVPDVARVAEILADALAAASARPAAAQEPPRAVRPADATARLRAAAA